MNPSERQLIEHQLSEILKAVDTIRAHLDRLDESEPRSGKKLTSADIEEMAKRDMERNGTRRVKR